MSFPESFDALSKPTPTTVRSSTGGISPANTVSSLIQSSLYLQYHLGLAPAAVAFTADSGTDTLTSAAHGLANNDVVSVISTGTLPGGLAIDTAYYVVSSTTNTFQLATTRGGSAIDLTSTGSGTHSFIALFSEGKILKSSSSGSRSQWSNAIDLSSGSFVLPQSTSIAPTAEGSVGWDTDDNLLKIGTGAATKTFMDLDSTQTATNKTLTAPTITSPSISGTVSGGATYSSPTLTTPTIASFVNANHDHTNSAGGGQLGTSALSDSAVTSAKLAAGVVVQVAATLSSAVSTGTTTIPSDDTIPQNTEGDEYMTVSITPKSTTNVLVVEVIAYLSNSAAVDEIGALFRDSTADAIAAGTVRNTAGGEQNMLLIRHTIAAGSTSATTFKFRAGGAAAGTTTINGTAGARRFGGITKSSMVVWEYKA